MKLKLLVRTMALAALVAASAQTVQAQNLVENPSFENGPPLTAIPTWANYGLGGSPAWVDDWTSSFSGGGVSPSGGDVMLNRNGASTTQLAFMNGLSAYDGDRAIQIPAEISAANQWFQWHALGKFNTPGGTLAAGCYKLCFAANGGQHSSPYGAWSPATDLCHDLSKIVEVELVATATNQRKLLGRYTVPFNSNWGTYGGTINIAAADDNLYDQIDLHLVRPEQNSCNGTCCAAVYIDAVSVSSCANPDMTGCTRTGCDADFQFSVGAYDPTQAVLTVMTSYSGIPLYESYRVTSSSAGTAPITTLGSSSILIPYGEYTVCHTLVTGANETCRVCKTFCFYGDGSGGKAAPEKTGTLRPDAPATLSPAMPGARTPAAAARANVAGAACDASFELRLESNDPATLAMLQFYVDPSSPAYGTYASESYQVSGNFQLPSTYSSGTTLFVPNGEYTVDHTVTMPDGQTCTKRMKACLWQQSNNGLKNGDAALNLANASVLATMALHPNPATEKADVSFVLGQAVPVDIQLVDALGRVLYSSSKKYGMGTQTVELPLAGIPTGIYTVKVNAGADQQTVKLSVLK